LFVVLLIGDVTTIVRAATFAAERSVQTKPHRAAEGLMSSARMERRKGTVYYVGSIVFAVLAIVLVVPSSRSGDRQ